MSNNQMNSAGNNRKSSRDAKENIFDGIYMKFISMIPVERPNPSEPSQTNWTRNGSAYKQENPSPLAFMESRHEAFSKNERVMIPGLEPSETNVIIDASVPNIKNSFAESHEIEHHETKETEVRIRHLFEGKIKQRSKTWMYDWLMDLQDTQYNNNLQGSLWNGWNSTTPDGLDSPEKIREELHSLQILMPAWTMLDMIATLVNSMQNVGSDSPVIHAGLAETDPDSNSAHVAVLNDNDSSVNDVHPVDVPKIVAELVAKLLDTLYEDLQREEEELNDPPAPLKWHQRVVKLLYFDRSSNEAATEADRISRATSTCSTRSRPCLFGPVGERPIHVCFLRAGHFPNVQGFKEGVLDGIEMFVAGQTVQGEIDRSFGKDYCAAVGSLIRHRLEKRDQGDSLRSFFLRRNGEVVSDENEENEADSDTVRNHDDRNPPFWLDLVAWAQAAFARKGKLRDTRTMSDLKTLTTCGLYEGETPLFMVIADKNPTMVNRLLKEYHVRPSKQLKGLFFRPMRRKLVERTAVDQWRYYISGASHCANLHAASKTSYLGLNPIFFAASQGPEKESIEILEALVGYECYVHTRGIGKVSDSNNMSTENAFDYHDLPNYRRAILNRPDEYGNTMLHLAAWSGSKETFKWLIENGADKNRLNREGMSPLSLTACFGLWEMFQHIHSNYFVKSVWEYGTLSLIEEDMSHIDTKNNVEDMRSIVDCVDRLLPLLEKVQALCVRIKRSETESERPRYDRDEIFAEKVLNDFRERCQEAKLNKVIENDDFEPFCHDTGKNANTNEPFLGVVEVIGIKKPPGWYKAAKDLVERTMLSKWNNIYNLVYLGQSVLPNSIIFIMFGLMWSNRDLQILSVNGVDLIIAKSESPEAGCGWNAMMSSYSGNLQIALVVYGVPSMLRFAWAQRRVYLSDIDEDGDLNFSYKEILGFLYQNSEPIFCLLISILFVLMTAARFAAGDECDSAPLHLEMTCTVFVGLFLFANLLNLVKPFKSFGSLVLSTLQIIATDIVTFGVMYMSLFASFLFAISTINLAYNHYLEELSSYDSTSTSTRFSILKNTGAGSENASESSTGCDLRALTTVDTAYRLLTLSLGDGLADTILMYRTIADDSCNGFKPDRLLGPLYIAWIVLTNILQLNLLIAMMTNTFDKTRIKIDRVWLLDICRRICRFEKVFPELCDRARAPQPAFSPWSISFWKAMGADFVIVIRCLPEVHFITNLVKLVWRQVTKVFGTNLWAQHPRKGMDILLALELKAGEGFIENLPKAALALRDRGLFWDISNVSFRRSWLVTILEYESAKFFRDNLDVIKNMSPNCTLDSMDSNEILKWRGALVQLIRRLLAHRPKPVRILQQQSKGRNVIALDSDATE